MSWPHHFEEERSQSPLYVPAKNSKFRLKLTGHVVMRLLPTHDSPNHPSRLTLTVIKPRNGQKRSNTTTMETTGLDSIHMTSTAAVTMMNPINNLNLSLPLSPCRDRASLRSSEVGSDERFLPARTTRHNKDKIRARLMTHHLAVVRRILTHPVSTLRDETSLSLPIYHNLYTPESLRAPAIDRLLLGPPFHHAKAV